MKTTIVASGALLASTPLALASDRFLPSNSPFKDPNAPLKNVEWEGLRQAKTNSVSPERLVSERLVSLLDKKHETHRTLAKGRTVNRNSQFVGDTDGAFAWTPAETSLPLCRLRPSRSIAKWSHASTPDSSIPSETKPLLVEINKLSSE
ncbi:hypothetical protein BJX64DRAFT_291465 [Aspergillus heterothallicus]